MVNTGVNDNGSGLTALLECAHLFVTQPCDVLRENSVILVAFDMGEEVV